MERIRQASEGPQGPSTNMVVSPWDAFVSDDPDLEMKMLAT